MEKLFEAFIKERRYGKGVSVRTEGWYRQSWQAFREALIGSSPESISKSDFSPVVEAMCGRGVSPITINTYARAINAFLRWLHEEERSPKPVRIPRLKEPETVVQTFRPEQVRHLMQYRPSCRNQRRVQTMALLILDTGVRLKEALSLRVGASGIVVYPDFSTILAMKAESKASILADMRRIYDGQLRKEYGTANNLKAREWLGRITFAVAATPVVDSHYGIFQSLGERFVMIRWGRPDGIEAALTAMNQDCATAKAELQEAVQILFGNLLGVEPALPEQIQHQVAALADFVTRARTHVARSGTTKEMLYEPEAEAPTRLAQQLSQLAKGSALLDDRPDVNEEDYGIVKRVAFDCIPTLRRKLIEAICRGEDSRVAASKSTLHYCGEDLRALALLEGQRLSELSLDRLTEARIIGEFTRTPSPFTVQ